MRDDLGLDRGEIGLGRRRPEIDRDHLSDRRAGLGRGRERRDGAFDPARGRLREVEVEVDARGDAFGAQRLQAGVDRLADGAEFHVGRVAERQHGECDAVEARRAIAHEHRIGCGRARRRLAFAPGRRDDDQPAGRRQRRHVEVGHVDDRWPQAALARELGQVGGQAFAVAGFAREHDRQRLGGARDRGRPGGRRLAVGAGQESGEPGALDRVGGADHAIENLDLVLGERRGLRDSGQLARHDVRLYAGSQGEQVFGQTAMPRIEYLFCHLAIDSAKKEFYTNNVA